MPATDNPYRPPTDASPDSEPSDATDETGARSRSRSFSLIAQIALLLAGVGVGFYFGVDLLILKQDVLVWLGRGAVIRANAWTEGGLDEFLFVVALLPLFVVPPLVLAVAGVRRAWLVCLTGIPAGLLAYQLWNTSMQRFVVTWDGYVWEFAGGVTHMLMVPIGVALGEFIRQGRFPKLSLIDCVVILATLAFWGYAIVRPERVWITWISLASSVILAIWSVRCQRRFDRIDAQAHADR